MDPLHCISSMATRPLLQALCARWSGIAGRAVRLESVGGVDAARRIGAGEAADVAVLDADALRSLAAAGRVGTVAPVAVSGVSIAAREGAAPPIATIPELQATLRASRAIGHSTGSSGRALLALLAQWGLRESLRDRLVQAPPGVAVGELLVRGEVDLGFQQRSELVHRPGIALLGPMPPGSEIATVFSAAPCTAGARPWQAAAFIAYLRSPACADAIRREGMEPVAGSRPVP